MRFKEFLMEEDFDLLAGLSKIKEECGPFLHESDGLFLYRGMKIDRERVHFTPHVKQRSPRDSSRAFNAFFNAGVELTYGIENIRPRSVFATGHKGDASEYGEIFFIFPKGEVKVLYSPMVEDSYLADDELNKSFAQYFGIESDNVLSAHKPKNAAMKIANAFLRIVVESGNDVELAVKNILTNEALVEAAFDDLTSKAGRKIEIGDVHFALQNTFHENYAGRKDLLGAIRSNKEILIYESEGYYSVPLDAVNSHIRWTEKLEGQSPEEFLTNYFHP